MMSSRKNPVEMTSLAQRCKTLGRFLRQSTVVTQQRWMPDFSQIDMHMRELE